MLFNLAYYYSNPHKNQIFVGIFILYGLSKRFSILLVIHSSSLKNRIG